MAAYSGRDKSRKHYLDRWASTLGGMRLSELDADIIGDALDGFAARPKRKFKGRALNGQPIYTEAGKWSPATVNRCKATLSGVLTWAKKQRLTPRGWTNPCRDLAGESESNGRTRFLAAEELERLLRVCRISAQPRLYLLVLMAVTTGARRGELMALRGLLDHPGDTVCIVPPAPAFAANLRQ
jgi:integrase